MAHLPMSKPRKRSRPSSVFPPVLVFLCATFAALALDALVLPLAISPDNLIRIAVGPVLILIGAALWISAWLEFRRRGETFSHRYTTQAVVTTGPYRISRHPAYLAYAVIMAGVGLLMDNAWVFAFLPVAVLFVDANAARREERYLMAKHESVYRPYRMEVRRWI